MRNMAKETQNTKTWVVKKSYTLQLEQKQFLSADALHKTSSGEIFTIIWSGLTSKPPTAEEEINFSVAEQYSPSEQTAG
jgi:hypothetical protein